MLFIPIRFKITLSIFLIVILFSTGVALVVKDSISKNISQITIDTSKKLIRVNETLVIKALLEDDYWSIYKFLNSLININLIKSAGFVDENYKIVAHTDPKTYPIHSTLKLDTIDSNQLVIPLESDQVTFGYFILTIDPMALTPYFQNIKRNLFFSIIIAALLSFFIGYVISKRILGRLELLSYNAKMIQDKKWDHIKYIKCVEQDEITNLVNSMESMLTKVQTMIKSEENLKQFYHNILESLHELVVVCNENFDITYDNLHELRKLVMKNHSFDTHVYQKIQTNLRKKSYTFVLELENENGKSISLYVIVKKLGDERIVSFTDITLLRMLQEQQCFTHSFEIVGEIASVVVHEVKNYLQPIKLLLEEDSLDKEDRGRIINIISKIDTLVKDFLKNGRPIDKKLAYDLNIKESIHSILFLFADALRTKEITVHKNIEKNIEVFIAKHDFDTIVTNLLKNAIEASFRHGNILINCFRDKGYITLQICDNGEGIDKNTLKNISKPFSTTKVEGSGVGLYSVYKLVYLYGGFIDIESVPGRTIFSINIPIAKD